MWGGVCNSYIIPTLRLSYNLFYFFFSSSINHSILLVVYIFFCNEIKTYNIDVDLTGKYATAKAEYSIKINMIEKAALEADDKLYSYILKAVTENLSYAYLKTRLDIPCSKDTYYDRYRRFFWLLNKYRN